MPFNGEVHEVVDQLRVGHAARRPQLRVHADRGKARQGVDFVHVGLAGGGFEEEIHPRQPGGVDRLEGGHRHGAQVVGEAGINIGRDAQFARCVVAVFRFVIVKLARRNNLADDRSPRLIISQDAALKLAAVQPLLDQYAAVIAARQVQRVGQFASVTHLGNPHARPQVCRLDEQRRAQRLQHAVADPCRLPLPLVTPDEQVRRHGQAGGGKERLHDGLVHAGGRPQHSRSDVGHVGEFQQPLHGAVLAISAVQQRKYDVHRLRLLRL